MILINVIFKVKEEYADKWLEEIDWFTTATREEEGNLYYDWYQSPTNKTEFALLEGFDESGVDAHVNSDHFKRFIKEAPQYLVETPQIINTQTDSTWGPMGEITV